MLVQSVRKNIEKIDKIVSRLALPAPMAFSRIANRTSSMTDPVGETNAFSSDEIISNRLFGASKNYSLQATRKKNHHYMLPNHSMQAFTVGKG